MSLIRPWLILAEAGRVELTAEVVEHVAVGAQHRADVQLVDERGAVAPVVQKIESDVAAVAERIPDALHLRRVSVRSLEEAAVASDQLVGAVTGQLLEGAVDEDDRIVRLVRIGEDHRHPGLLDRRQQLVVPCRGGADGTAERGAGRLLLRPPAQHLGHTLLPRQDRHIISGQAAIFQQWIGGRSGARLRHSIRAERAHLAATPRTSPGIMTASRQIVTMVLPIASR